MPRKVFKYDVVMDDTFKLSLPQGAEVLSVGVQFGEPRMWVLVEPTAPVVERTFRVAGTGHHITGSLKFIGTFQLEGGALIFHLFEVLS